jgi:hypothetical protein
MALSSCRVASNAGAAFGVALGCVLGMFPLIFYKDEENEKEGGESASKKSG